MNIRTKRIYEKPSPDDGLRIYVDRLWARGLKKEEAQLDEWMREISPSNELRREFHHNREKWSEFRERYYQELEGKSDLVRKLLESAKKNTVTLLFSAKDVEYNNAVALREYLEKVASQKVADS